MRTVLKWVKLPGVSILRVSRAWLDKALSNIIGSHGWTYTEQLVGLEISWGPCQTGLSCDPRSFNSLYSPDFKVQFVYEKKLETDSRDQFLHWYKMENSGWRERLTLRWRHYIKPQKVQASHEKTLLPSTPVCSSPFFSHISQQGTASWHLQSIIKLGFNFTWDFKTQLLGK